jgi:magnesium transporter
VGARWIDLVDPSPDEVHGALPARVDPAVAELLASRPGTDGDARPLIEGHGPYVFGMFVAARPGASGTGVSYVEVGMVATTDVLVTVRWSGEDGGDPFDPVGLHSAAADPSTTTGVLAHRLVDDVADSFMVAVDVLYGTLEELEDGVDRWPASQVRERIGAMRQELLRVRRIVSATRGAVRHISAGRVDIGDHGLFPPSVELLFADTTEALFRVTEELDIARDLLAGVRDHHHSRVAESQGDIVRKLTVIASLVLVPSLVVGYFGQNFQEAFDEPYWSLGVSTGLIVASSVVQVALFRWRRWI